MLSTSSRRCLIAVVFVSVALAAGPARGFCGTGGNNPFKSLGCALYTMAFIGGLALPELSMPIDVESGEPDPGLAWELPVMVVHGRWLAKRTWALVAYGSVAYHFVSTDVVGRFGGRGFLDVAPLLSFYADIGGFYGSSGGGPRLGMGLMSGRNGFGLYAGATWEPLILDTILHRIEVSIGISVPLIFF